MLWRITGSITLDGEQLVLGERYDEPVGGFVECNARNFVQSELRLVRPALELFGEYAVYLDCVTQSAEQRFFLLIVRMGYWPGEPLPGDVRLAPLDGQSDSANTSSGGDALTCMGSRVYEQPLLLRELARQGGFYNPGSNPTEWAISDPLWNERQLTATVVRRPGQEEPEADCVGPRDSFALDLRLVATEETVEVVQNECPEEE